LCALLLAGCSLVGGSAGEAAPQPPPGVGTTLDAPVPRALLATPFLDHRGRRVTLDSWRGKVLVISDVSTLCQESCAIGTAAMLQAARAVDRAGLGGKVEFLSITIDPSRDDTRHLAAYRRLFGALPNWAALTGSSADVDHFWDKLGIWRRTVRVEAPYPRDWLTGARLTTDIQHTDDLVFVDGGQRFRFEIDGPAAVRSASDVPSRIVGFMDDLGRRNISDPSAGSWSGAQVQHVLRWLLSQEATR
jgi:protein SCO1/2